VGLTDLVFHDTRHTATTNLRRAGVDALTAMKIAGHKTMAVFKRYNTIDEDDLTAAQRQLDTYMDTKTLSPSSNRCKFLNYHHAGVAEWVDAQDLKSCGGRLPCRFESDPRHLKNQCFMDYPRSSNQGV
jgi:integrase-like protein